MIRRILGLLAIASLGLTTGPGCMSQPDARYVYQDGHYGVIGIPRNSPLGKKDYRSQAAELMTRHFPEGYEIVRAEEVVEGERTLDTAIKKELETDPGFLALNQALKIGKIASSSAIDQKDTIHITESRIIYKRKDAGKPAGNDGFSLASSDGPPLYLDPNEAVRKVGVEAMFLVKKEIKSEDKEKEKEKKLVAAKEKTRDGEVSKAGGEVAH